MHQACRVGQVATIRQLLDGGVPVDALNAVGWTPLHTAIRYKQREAVELLLDRGANIEAVAVGMTPLLWAIWIAESEDLAGLLLDRGASALAVDEGNGSTALHWAARRGLLIIMGRLIDMGLSVDVRNNIGENPLMLAAQTGKKEALEYLLGRGAAINAQNNDGYTALHWACLYGNTESAKVLLLRGIDPTIKDNKGKTAFEVFGERVNPKPTAEQKAAAVSALNNAHKEYLLGRLAEVESRNAVLERPVLATTSLLFSDDISDVEVVCGDGERIPAHRCILAACSQPLRASLLGPWVESAKREITIDQSGAAVRALLRFMYTGEAEAAALDANLQEVLELAALYEQADLKAACEERGLAGLQMKSVVPLLVAAHLHDLGKLKQACVDLIKASSLEFALSVSSGEFNQLAFIHPSLWKETRTALGLPVEEEEELDE